MADVEKVMFDHTMGDETLRGRYEGDYMATLTFNPIVDHQYRWTVEVKIWVEERYTAKGHADGYVDRDGWGRVHPIFGDHESKSFKTSEKAIAYLCTVRAVADAEFIRRRLARISQGQSTQIA